MFDFQDVVGQEAVKEHFRTAVSSDRVSHAYMLIGEAGLGKNALADAFSKMLLCERDLKRMPKDFIDKLGYGFKVSPVPAPIEDGFVLKYGEIEINCTFKALFSAAEQELRARANTMLFG